MNWLLDSQLVADACYSCFFFFWQCSACANAYMIARHEEVISVYNLKILSFFFFWCSQLSSLLSCTQIRVPTLAGAFLVNHSLPVKSPRYCFWKHPGACTTSHYNSTSQKRHAALAHFILNRRESSIYYGYNVPTNNSFTVAKYLLIFM